MNRLISTFLTGLLVLAATTAEARADDGERRDRFSQRSHDSRQFDDSRFEQRRAQRNERIRLDFPLHVRGDRRIKLHRLARHHGIDLADYRIVKVVVRSHGPRRSYARLSVGHGFAEAVPLHHGRVHIHAPRGRQHGRAVLGLANARVDKVRLVLEPKYRRHHDYAHHGARRSYDPWWSDRKVIRW